MKHYISLCPRNEHALDQLRLLVDTLNYELERTIQDADGNPGLRLTPRSEEDRFVVEIAYLNSPLSLNIDSSSSELDADSNASII